MINPPGQTIETTGPLDETLRPEAVLSAAGWYEIEGDHVVVTLEEGPLVFDATELMVRLRRVGEEDDTSDDLRTTAERIGARLQREVDAYTLSDAASFLHAVGSLPTPPPSYEVMPDTRRASLQDQLRLTLKATIQRGDTDGEALVNHYLDLLELE